MSLTVCYLICYPQLPALPSRRGRSRIAFGRGAESVGAVGEQLVRIYVDRFRDEPIIATEIPFEIDVPGGDGYRVRGYFDSPGPEHRLFELKTSAPRPSVSDLELRPQLGIYRAAYQDLHHVEPDVFVVSLLKQKKPAIEITLVPPTSDEFFMGVVRDVGRAIDAGSFPASPSVMNCPRCEYRRACEQFREQAANDNETRRHVAVVA